MKHLSRVLSLALVIALSLSLVVVAGAAVTEYENYTDAADIEDEYVEAVDVLTALGVFQGNDDGSLKPKSTFTRAQAAKIATYISIGTTAADRLTAQPSSFTDVAPSHWANPFIEYAAKRGIVNGVGNGRFNPEGAVTGSQLAKMLLVSLGYGAKNEYVGPSWELNAIVDGQTHGILSINTNYSEPAKREEAIQYVFNTIRPDNPYHGGDRNFLVKLNSLINDYVLANQDSVLISGSEQFLGPESFGLWTTSPVTDPDGFQVATWASYSRTITGSYKRGAELSRTTGGTPIVSPFGIALTDPDSPFFVAELEDNTASVLCYINGSRVTLDAATASSAKIGSIVYLYDSYDNGKVDRVVIIEKAVAELASAPIVNSVMNTVTIAAITTDAISGTKIQYPAGLVKDDVVLWYKDAKDVYHVELAASVTGKMTSYKISPPMPTQVVFDGTTYNVSTLNGVGPFVIDPTVAATGALGYLFSNNGYFNVDATMYLDDNGSPVILQKSAAAKANYLFLVAVDVFSQQGKFYLPNGQLVVASIRRPANEGGEFTNGAPDIEKFYSYSANEAGTSYTLRAVAVGAGAGTTPQQGSQVGFSANVVGLENGRTSFLSGTPTTAIFGNGLTSFVIKRTPLLASQLADVKAYSGIGALPKIDLTNGYITDIYYVVTGGVANAVFIEMSGGYTGAVAELAYIVATDFTIVNPDLVYTKYSWIKNTVLQTSQINVENSIDPGYLYEVIYNAAGDAIESASTYGVRKNGIAQVVDLVNGIGTITFADGTTYTYDSAGVAYVFGPDGSPALIDSGIRGLAPYVTRAVDTAICIQPNKDNALKADAIYVRYANAIPAARPTTGQQDNINAVLTAPATVAAYGVDGPSGASLYAHTDVVTTIKNNGGIELDISYDPALSRIATSTDTYNVTINITGTGGVGTVYLLDNSITPPSTWVYSNGNTIGPVAGTSLANVLGAIVGNKPVFLPSGPGTFVITLTLNRVAGTVDNLTGLSLITTKTITVS
jgi:hypothetical protein